MVDARTYKNPFNAPLLYILIFCIFLNLVVDLCLILTSLTDTNEPTTIIYFSFIECIPISLIFIFIILRPIRIQIEESNIILYYHFTKPKKVSWGEIQIISITEDEKTPIEKQQKVYGRLKLRSQRSPSFISYEIARAIFDSYKGNGQVHRYGVVSVIED